MNHKEYEDWCIEKIPLFNDYLKENQIIFNHDFNFGKVTVNTMLSEDDQKTICDYLLHCHEKLEWIVPLIDEDIRDIYNHIIYFIVRKESKQFETNGFEFKDPLFGCIGFYCQIESAEKYKKFPGTDEYVLNYGYLIFLNFKRSLRQKQQKLKIENEAKSFTPFSTPEKIALLEHLGVFAKLYKDGVKAEDQYKVIENLIGGSNIRKYCLNLKNNNKTYPNKYQITDKHKERVKKFYNSKTL